MLRRGKEQGDTIIEVLLAFVILATVTVGAYSVLNRGVAQAQGSLERSQVRTSIDSQVELMTYFRDQYLTALSQNFPVASQPPAQQWAQIKTYASGNNGKTPTNINQCSSALANSFYIEKDAATGLYTVKGSPSVTANILPVAGQGLWVEPIPSASGVNPAFIDLYVRACWDPIAGNTKQALSTVVRLYDKN